MLNKSLVTWRKRLAIAGEDAACDYYQRQGYQLVARNWRSGRLGEVDLIMREPTGMLVFIEVKTRRLANSNCGFENAGFEAVDRRKQQKIVTCARAYMSQSSSGSRSCRFDVLVVYYVLSSPPGSQEPLPAPIITQICAAF